MFKMSLLFFMIKQMNKLYFVEVILANLESSELERHFKGLGGG